ncbi:MAG: hypothetical protein ACLU38_13495 [Dysosmobacter sp.]
MAKGTEVYVYVNASTAVDAGVYGKEIAVAGYNTVLLTNADSTTAKKRSCEDHREQGCHPDRDRHRDR